MKASEPDTEAGRWCGTSNFCAALAAAGAFVAGQPKTAQVMVKSARKDANATPTDRGEATVAKH